MGNDQRVYTVAEIQQILGLSRGSAYTFIKSNPPFKVYTILGSYRVNKESFDDWFNDILK
jgi:hypothetical protein